MSVPPQCQNGSVWWNYPQGTLQVVFHSPRPAIVCLTAPLGPVVAGIEQVVHGHEVPVTSPPGQYTYLSPLAV